MADFPVINGRRYSWASIEAKLDGQVYTGIRSIDWDQELAPEKVKAKGALPRGRTKGEYDANASIEWLKHDADYFRSVLAATDPSYATVEFEIVVQFAEAEGDPVSTVVLELARVMKETESNAQGSAAPAVEKWDLSIMRIKKNGLYMVEEN